ncbi:MAG: hypothetical protein HKP37_11475 [Boseongicola sp.]|nr:hypothetical protein [Boseongicola sp.]NNL19349.1 hypothetical protein [Boseongicola sp.]
MRENLCKWTNSICAFHELLWSLQDYWLSRLVVVGGISGGGASDAVNYVPVHAASLADTAFTSIDGGGITGVLSQADLSLSSTSSRLRSITVRVSADGNTAFLTVDGSTQSLPDVIKQSGGGQFGNVPSNVLQVVGSGASHVFVTYSGSLRDTSSGNNYAATGTFSLD